MNTREQIFELEWSIREKLKEVDAAIVAGEYQHAENLVAPTLNGIRQLRVLKSELVSPVGLPAIALLPTNLLRPGQFFCERTNQIMAEPEGGCAIE